MSLMRRNRRHLIASVIAFCTAALVTGCSKSNSDSNSGGGRSTSSAAIKGTACDNKWITSSDAAGILSEPIVAMKPLAGDPQSCRMMSDTGDEGGPQIKVSVRPGLGKATVEAWATGKMPMAASSLSGIGDSAVWIADLHEVDAQKNDVLCTIDASGATPALAADPAALSRKLGDLCSTIFARLPAEQG